MVLYWAGIVWNILGGIAGIAWLRVMYLVFTQPSELHPNLSEPDANGKRHIRLLQPFWSFTKEGMTWSQRAYSEKYDDVRRVQYRAFTHFALAILMMVIWLGILLITGIA